MFGIKIKTADQVKLERMQVENEKLKADLDYLSMMVDVPVPDNSTEEEKEDA